VFCYGRSLR
jgi:GNAT superfamily N-acetyltransferase